MLGTAPVILHAADTLASLLKRPVDGPSHLEQRACCFPAYQIISGMARPESYWR